MRLGAASLLGAAMMSSCHIYNKFDMPTDTDLTRSYVEARDAEADSAALGNLGWEKVFTDPLLQDYINRALANNTNLENARLNVDVARANLLGAKLSYLPAVAFTPNGAGASYAHSPMSWTYTLPSASAGKSTYSARF